MERLFVSFNFTNYKYLSGYGCTVIKYDKSIISMNDIQEITEIINHDGEYEEVVITNFRRMEGNENGEC